MSLQEHSFRAGAGPTLHAKAYTGYKADWDLHPDTLYKTLDGVSYMDSYNHPSWRRTNAYKNGDSGGPWAKQDVITSYSPVTLQQFGPVSGSYGHCILETYTASSDLVSLTKQAPPTTYTSAKTFCSSRVPQPNITDMNSKGSTAISRCEPTRPSADLSTAIGELLHDGIPSLPGKAEGNVGEEYLNLQFGWSPTISDGRSFIQAVRNSDRTALQYARDSGTLVRRRYDFPLERSVSSITESKYPGYWGGPSSDVVHTGTRVTTTTVETRTWFSGAFTYHIPRSALGRTVYQLDKKYGILPGVDTLWQLTPYSWLVDWFSNAGDVIHNLNAFTENGLVMAYGYVMQDTIKTIDCSWVGTLRDWQAVYRPYTLVDQIVYRSRQRIQATPYGFGLDWNGFNPFQLSILAALGITRVL